MANLFTSELHPSELTFVHAMQRLGFGQFESVRIIAGELALEPWPRMVQSVKFGASDIAMEDKPRCEFELKQQVVQFIERVRSIEDGEIRLLEVRHGLPFAMQVECRSSSE